MLNNLLSGALGAIIGAAISLYAYIKQRNDELIDQLKIRFCDMHEQLRQAKYADRYTQNSVNQVDYVYTCDALNDLKSLYLSLDLLLDNGNLKDKLMQTIASVETLLEEELSKWQSFFYKEHFSNRKSVLPTIINHDQREKALLAYLKQDIHSLKIQLGKLEEKFINLEQELLNTSKEYIASKKWCFI